MKIELEELEFFTIWLDKSVCVNGVWTYKHIPIMVLPIRPGRQADDIPWAHEKYEKYKKALTLPKQYMLYPSITSEPPEAFRFIDDPELSGSWV